MEPTQQSILPPAAVPVVPVLAPTALTTRVPLAEIERLDALATQCAGLQRQDLTPFRRTFLMAAGMQQLRNLISPAMMEDVMALQGSPLGFRTDKDESGGYPVEVVKEAAIEATLRGLRLVGNEINIIAKRMYAAKDGLKRLVRDWSGLSNLRIQIGIPRTQEGYTVVPCRAKWMLGGEEHTLDCTAENSIPVRVNEKGIVDAILGKAERKLFARIYERLLGYDHGLIESDGTAIAATDATLPGPDDAMIEAAIQEYTTRIAAAGSINEVSPIVRESGKDDRLDDATRRQVNKLANDRVSAIRNNRGDRANQ
jgi:hypothetical protein